MTMMISWFGFVVELREHCVSGFGFHAFLAGRGRERMKWEKKVCGLFFCASLDRPKGNQGRRI